MLSGAMFVWGAHAPRVLVLAPSPKRTSICLYPQTLGVSLEGANSVANGGADRLTSCGGTTKDCWIKQLAPHSRYSDN